MVLEVQLLVDPLLIVSPHLDDGVLSCGQLMAGRPETTLLACFAGAPKPVQSTPYDLASGFPDSTTAVKLRRREDALACKVLQAQPVHLPLLDGQYLLDQEAGRDWRLQQVQAQVLAVWHHLSQPDIICPLGLVHPDHQLVAEACQGLVDVVRKAGRQVVIYEELPARVLWPEAVPRALHRWGVAHWKVGADVSQPQLAPIFYGTGPIELKLEALSCYSSQLPLLAALGDGLGPHCWQVPERYWGPA